MSVDVHPNWYRPAKELCRDLRREFRADGKQLRQAIANVQREYGSLDVWRAFGRPAVHVTLKESVRG